MTMYSKSSVFDMYNEIHIVSSDGLLSDPIINFVKRFPKEKFLYIWIIKTKVNKRLLKIISKIEKKRFLFEINNKAQGLENVFVKNLSINDFSLLFDKHAKRESLKLYMVNPKFFNIDFYKTKGDYISTNINPESLNIFSLDETIKEDDFKEFTLFSSFTAQPSISMKHGLTNSFLQNKDKIEYAIFDYFFNAISERKFFSSQSRKFTLSTSINHKKFVFLSLASYIVKLIRFKIKQRLILLFEILFNIDSLSEFWSVGYFNHKTKQIHKLPNTYNFNLADPFVFKNKETNYCFVEKFNFKNNGEIHVYNLDRNSYVGLAIKESFHLSYPYVFEHKNGIYMLPETSQNNDVRLYKAKNFPLDWELSSVLLDDVRAVDSMLFYDDKVSAWLLLCNFASSAIDADFHSLKAFASNNLTGPFEEINNMQIINDSTIGRNGGLLRYENSIYRVSQYYGHNCYGKSVKVHKIGNVSTKIYAEEECIIDEIDFLKCCAAKLASGYKVTGFHHINNNKDFSVFDFKIKPRMLKMIGISKRKMPWI